MKLSFVIPAHDEERRLPSCLEGIFRELDGSHRDIEIIVVDNASTDRTAAAAERYPGVRVVAEPRKGIVWARARGLAEATGDLVANIDADTMLPPGWLERVFREFERDPKLVCLSGPHMYYDLAPWRRALVKIFYFFGYFFYLVARFVVRRGSLVQGGNFIFRKSAFLAAGGYDTTIDFYGEDTDVARRLVPQGRVKFTFGLPIYASGRRLAAEGLVTIGARYALNYFSVLFRGRPATMHHENIRPQERS